MTRFSARRSNLLLLAQGRALIGAKALIGDGSHSQNKGYNGSQSQNLIHYLNLNIISSAISTRDNTTTLE